MTDGHQEVGKFSDARYARATTDFMDTRRTLADLGPSMRGAMVGSWSTWASSGVEVIPSFKCNDVLFSDTYAKFAADLMADVSRELLAITTRLDWDLKFSRPDDQEYLRAQALSVDKPALVSAAWYCQWISEHLRYEVTQWRMTDLRIGERYAFDDPDKAALYRLEHQDVNCLAPVHDAPAFPGALQQIHRTQLLTISERAEKNAEIEAAGNLGAGQPVIDLSDDDYAHRLALIRETINTAANAMSRNKTKKTHLLRGHITVVAAWLG